MFILLISCKSQFNVFILVHLIELVHLLFFKSGGQYLKECLKTDYNEETGMDVKGMGEKIK